MTPKDSDSEIWAQAREVRDRLVAQFLQHPDVTHIDLGQVTEDDVTTVAVRIHVKPCWFQTPPEARVAFPTRVNNIPVVVIAGDYQLERNGFNPNR